MQHHFYFPIQRQIMSYWSFFIQNDRLLFFPWKHLIYDPIFLTDNFFLLESSTPEPQRKASIPSRTTVHMRRRPACPAPCSSAPGTPRAHEGELTEERVAGKSTGARLHQVSSCDLPHTGRQATKGRNWAMRSATRLWLPLKILLLIPLRRTHLSFLACSWIRRNTAWKWGSANSVIKQHRAAVIDEICRSAASR